MPQVDIHAYFEQAFWFIPTFFIFYVLVSRKIIIPVVEYLKIKRLLQLELELTKLKKISLKNTIFLKKHFINDTITNNIYEPLALMVNKNIDALEIQIKRETESQVELIEDLVNKYELNNSVILTNEMKKNTRIIQKVKFKKLNKKKKNKKINKSNYNLGYESGYESDDERSDSENK